LVLTFCATKSDLALEVVFDDLFDALGSIGEFPVAGHHIHAEQFASIDHVLAFAPHGGAGTLPGVAAIEQQRTGAGGTDFLDQRRQVGEAADLAVGFRRLLEIEVGEGVASNVPGLT